MYEQEKHPFEGPEVTGETKVELPSADAVVVMGGELKRNNKGEVVVGLESKMRSLGAAELFRHGLVKEIIVTGGIAKEFPGEKSIAEAMGDYLIKKGVPPERIRMETTSKNTAENIENIIDILEREGMRSIILETNEFHLPRAKLLFEHILKRHGLKVEEEEISAEELLEERSSHYKRLTSYYKFPSSLQKLPKASAMKYLYEFLRRVLIHIDREDKIAKFLAHKVR